MPGLPAFYLGCWWLILGMISVTLNGYTLLSTVLFISSGASFVVSLIIAFVNRKVSS